MRTRISLLTNYYVKKSHKNILFFQDQKKHLYRSFATGNVETHYQWLVAGIKYYCECNSTDAYKFLTRLVEDKNAEKRIKAIAYLYLWKSETDGWWNGSIEEYKNVLKKHFEDMFKTYQYKVGYYISAPKLPSNLQELVYKGINHYYESKYADAHKCLIGVIHDENSGNYLKAIAHLYLSKALMFGLSSSTWLAIESLEKARELFKQVQDNHETTDDLYKRYKLEALLAFKNLMDDCDGDIDSYKKKLKTHLINLGISPKNSEDNNVSFSAASHDESLSNYTKISIKPR